MNEHQENPLGENKHFAIVVARFNEFITSELLDGAIRALTENKVQSENIDVWWVPGALEIPAMVRTCAQSKRYHGIVAIGCIIKGATDHYKYVCDQAMSGVQAVANTGTVAIGNAILTVREVDHASERARKNADNKGWEAAMATLMMSNHLAQFPSQM
ncbi:MAG: 6,7-dimethyl-8-ribityllumazine synthase [Candidatus Sumerlaeales bacterium]|nr:6,7-dimethyl-8-ribityllumazine synthase [Candidatus Sumerlaeales bacterium]